MNFRAIVKEFILSGNEEIFNMRLWGMDPIQGPFIKQEIFQVLCSAKLSISLYDYERIANLLILDGVIVLEVYSDG